MAKRGRPEARLKVDGPWEQAVGTALARKPPKDGWPKPPVKKRGRPAKRSRPKAG